MRSIISLSFILFFVCCKYDKEEFSLCSGSAHPYYYPSLQYKGDFYEIKKHFYKNYKNIYGEGNTGIVRIQFQVNCLGEVGNYKITTYSLDYKAKIINEEIVNQLMQLTKGLKKWIPAVNEDGESVDSHKFFAFKVIDGKLKDILPK